MRTVPEAPAAQLTTFERAWAWFKINRTSIGGLILSISALVRVFLTFQGHTEIADTLKAIADLCMGAGAATLAAGATKSDDYHEEKLEGELRMRSGKFPAYQRRRTDEKKES